MAMTGGDKLEAHLKGLADKLGQGELLRVGFLESAKYPDGTQVAQVAFWNEYGTKTAPPRPFFRNTIAKGKSTWGDDLGKILKAVDYDGEKALALMGDRIKGQVQQSISDLNSPALSALTLMIRKIKQGRTDAPTTLDDVKEAARLLAAGESTAGVNDKPLVYTNVMRTSVDYEVQGGA